MTTGSLKKLESEKNGKDATIKGQIEATLFYIPKKF